jgi:Tetratricopeptide repeat
VGVLRRALAIREKALGPDHELVAITAGNLATFLSSQGAHAEAEALCQRSLRILKARLGERHPQFVAGLEGYAAVLTEMDRKAQAEAVAQRARALRAGNV